MQEAYHNCADYLIIKVLIEERRNAEKLPCYLFEREEDREKEVGG